MGHAALAEGKRLHDNQSQRMALQALIESARYEGRHQLAMERFADLRRLSDTAHLAEEIRTLQNLDRHDEAESKLAQMRQAQEGEDTLLPSMLFAQMWQDHNLARLDAAEAGARTLLRLADEIGNYYYRVQSLLVLSWLAVYRGDLEESAAIVASVVDSEREASEKGRGTRLRLAQGWIEAELGRFDESVAKLKPLLGDSGRFQEVWPWSPFWMRYFAWVGVNAGDRELVDKALHVAELLAERNPGNEALAANALHVRGLQSGDPEVLARAVDGLRKSARPLPLADASRHLGETLLDQDRHDEGVAALTEALEIYRRVGSVNYVRAVTATLRRHGVMDEAPPRQRRESGWQSLTPTELTVAELVSAGHSNRSAASRLQVSPNTVNTHLRSIFRKLDVRSRVALSIAYRDHAGVDGVGPPITTDGPR
jgi:DNA-binding CsgD family transcriptional regulator